jgi:hypothetical protein
MEVQINMADNKQVMTQAFSAFGTGLVVKYIPNIKSLSGSYTEWITAGAFGVIGLFGVYSARGAWSNIGMGMLDGSVAMIGSQFADMIAKKTTTTPAPSTSYTYYGAAPKLIGYTGAGAVNLDDDKKRMGGTKAFVEI